MPIYSDKAILDAIDKGILSITPLQVKNIQPASIDLTLGEDIEILTLDKIDIFSVDINMLRNHIKKINIMDGYDLAPNTYVIGYSAEKLKFSTFINGHIKNRNSLVLCGLDVSASSYINPGFEGYMPLVIRNFGKAVITLRPGVRVCQLEISQLTSQSLRNYNNRHNIDSLMSYATTYTSHNFKNDEVKDTTLADFLHERILAVAKGSD